MKNRMKWYVLPVLLTGLLIMTSACSYEGLAAAEMGLQDGSLSAQAVSEDSDSLVPLEDAVSEDSDSPVLLAQSGDTPLTHLEVLMPFMPWSFDTRMAGHPSNDQVARLVFQNLFRLCYDTAMPVPELAASWEFGDDTSVLNITVIGGAAFHNGDPLTAHDVAFTLTRLGQTEWPEPFFEMVDHAVSHDDYNLTLYLRYPFAPILHNLAHLSFGIIPMNHYLEVGTDYFAQNPIGSGAFKFVDHIDDGLLRSILLARFDGYIGSLPVIESITIRHGGFEPADMFYEISSGTADIAIDFPVIHPDELAEAYEDPNIFILRRPSAALDFIWLNTMQPYLDNPLVRRAIAYAIDNEAILEQVYLGRGIITHTALPTNAFGFVEMPPFTTNLDRARELLTEAGLYPQGFETVIWYNIPNMQRRDIAEIVQQNLRQLNIDVRIEAFEWGDYLTYSGEGLHHMLLLGWIVVTGEADYGLFSLFHSSRFGNDGNRAFFYNAELDYLLETARAHPDLEVRRELYARALRIIHDEAPVVMLRQNEHIVAVSPRIGEFSLNPHGFHNFAVIGIVD